MEQTPWSCVLIVKTGQVFAALHTAQTLITEYTRARHCSV